MDGQARFCFYLFFVFLQLQNEKLRERSCPKIWKKTFFNPFEVNMVLLRLLINASPATFSCFRELV